MELLYAGFVATPAMVDADTKRLAVLIDADNVTASLTSKVMAEIVKLRHADDERAYGDLDDAELSAGGEEL